MAERPREWVIEVCRTCGRVAQWPFCEHRQEWLDAYFSKPVFRPSWCETVRVREVERRVRRDA